MSQLQQKQQKKNDGQYQKKKLSLMRRATIETFAALPPGHNMLALAEIDVTELRKRLRKERRKGRRGSFFACLLKAIALTLKEYPALNAVLGKKAVFEFKDVDINLPVELPGEAQPEPRQITLRRVAEKSVPEIEAEIAEAREHFADSASTGEEDRRALRMMRFLFLLPKFLRRFLLRKLVQKPLLVKRMSGTTFVTSVANVGKSARFALPYIVGNRAVSFAVNTVNRETSASGEAREMLSLTVVFNHDIVDGARAGRFLHALKKRLEEVVGIF